MRNLADKLKIEPGEKIENNGKNEKQTQKKMKKISQKIQKNHEKLTGKIANVNNLLEKKIRIGRKKISIKIVLEKISEKYRMSRNYQ